MEMNQQHFTNCVQEHRLQGSSMKEAKMTCMELTKQVKKAIKGRGKKNKKHGKKEEIFD